MVQLQYIYKLYGYLIGDNDQILMFTCSDLKFPSTNFQFIWFEIVFK